MNVLRQKTNGFRKLLSLSYSGICQDAPFFGRRKAIHWHALTVHNQLRHYLRLPPIGDPIKIHLSGCEHPVWLRPRTTDYQAYQQIFIEQEYAGVRETTVDVNFILDCGANAGLASVYFLNCFPRARVLAIEPDSENVAICRRNLAPYGDRATVLQGGVWNDRSRLAVVPSEFGGGGNKWGIQVRPFHPGDAERDAVEAFDIPSLLAHAGADYVDLLKIDIERSELPVFSSSTDRWLPRVRNLVIELHGDDCSKAFFSALEHYEYRLSHRGDLTYCLGLKELSPASPARSAL